MDDPRVLGRVTMCACTVPVKANQTTNACATLGGTEMTALKIAAATITPLAQKGFKCVTNVKITLWATFVSTVVRGVMATLLLSLGKFCNQYAVTLNKLIDYRCKKCECNGHGDVDNGECDMESGECFCQDNTEGPHCERCRINYSGDPRNGNQCYYQCEARGVLTDPKVNTLDVYLSEQELKFKYH